MDVYIPRKGRIRLSQTDFVGQGGEGAVYVKGDRAYKLYTDPCRVVPAGKLRELSVLTSPQIIRPEEIVVDGQGKPTGYSMRRLDGGFALGQLFTRSFRDQKGVGAERALSLVQLLQSGITYVHQHGILVVDLNDTNFRVDDACSELHFIDVDSYQTASYPATAIMESIRDRHAHGFSTATDWFSFGIVSFQLFVGIHPYRGKHPSVGDLETRMQRNQSILRPGVIIPGCCYPLTSIPQAYRDWYRAIFDDGKRLPPPDDATVEVVIKKCSSSPLSSERLQVSLVAVFPGTIVRPLFGGRAPGAMTCSGIYVDGNWHPAGPDSRIGLAPREQSLIAASIQSGRLRLRDLARSQDLTERPSAEALSECEGRLYVKSRDTLYQVAFMELPTMLRAGLQSVGNVLAHATRLFDGVAMQNILGATYAMLLAAPGKCFPVHLPELDGWSVIEASYVRRLLIVSAARAGRYSRYVFRFDPGFTSYDVRVAHDLPQAGLNFAVLDTGVCVMVNENDELELFSHRKNSSERKIIDDPAIRGGTLSTDGSRLYLSKDRTLYGLSLRA